jgi:hypothetical protein
MPPDALRSIVPILLAAIVIVVFLALWCVPIIRRSIQSQDQAMQNIAESIKLQKDALDAQARSLELQTRSLEQQQRIVELLEKIAHRSSLS